MCQGITIKKERLHCDWENFISWLILYVLCFSFLSVLLFPLQFSVEFSGGVCKYAWYLITYYIYFCTFFVYHLSQELTNALQNISDRFRSRRSFLASYSGTDWVFSWRKNSSGPVFMQEFILPSCWVRQTSDNLLSLHWTMDKLVVFQKFCYGLASASDLWVTS